MLTCKRPWARARADVANVGCGCADVGFMDICANVLFMGALILSNTSMDYRCGEYVACNGVSFKNSFASSSVKTRRILDVGGETQDLPPPEAPGC